MRSRRAITLVEVLAGTALLGTLLMAMIVANGRLIEQSSAAERRLDAYRILDELLDEWWANPEGVPREGEGALYGRPGWRWRTSTIDDPDAAELGGSIIAIELFAPASENTHRDAITTPVAHIEIIVAEEGRRD